MKLVGVGLLLYRGDAATPVFIGMATDVSNFGYFQRGAVREGIMFIARTIAQRTTPGMRQTVKNDEYLCHVHVKDNGLAGVVVADAEYPTTAAFAIISKVLDDFMLQQGQDDGWRALEADSAMATPTLEEALRKYQVRCALHTDPAPKPQSLCALKSDPLETAVQQS
jgi:synaptobrevin family protein YKT6